MPQPKTSTFELSTYCPWLDRAGHVSAFKSIVFALLLLPGIYVVWQLATGGYARPYILANHDLGLWSIRFLFVALAITPLRKALALPRLIQVRRMIGVAAFCYAVAHFLFYALDKSLQWGAIASEIVLRYYLTIGFVALVLITALGVTSTDAMVRRLGGKRWMWLHRAVYLIGGLAVVHFFIQMKADVTEPFIMGGLFAWLMLYRVLARRGPVPFAALIAMAIVLSGLTAGAEALYYNLKSNADFVRVLSANLSFGIGVRPSWLVGGIGVLVALLALARPLWAKDAGRQPAAVRA